MRTVLIPVLVGWALPGVLVLTPPERDAAAVRTPVLVELFTSEGCSSCPPADRLLVDLLDTQPVPGVEIIALEEHVDYWNHQGWADPYSSAQFSERQSEYARVVGKGSVYTPQVIVDGQAELVGGQAGPTREAIARAARSAKIEVTIIRTTPTRLEAVDSAAGRPPPGGSHDIDSRARKLVPKPDIPVEDTVPVSLRVAPLPRSVTVGPADVWLAVTEDGLASDVTGGENGGRRLAHSAVARSLTRVGTLGSEPGTGFETEARVGLDPAWNRPRLRLVAFVQDNQSRRVLGTTAVALSR